MRLFSSPAKLGFSSSLTASSVTKAKSGGQDPTQDFFIVDNIEADNRTSGLRFWVFRKLERWHSCNAKDVRVASILIIAHQDGVIRRHPLHSGASLPIDTKFFKNKLFDFAIKLI